jgi:hypothetical protein
MIRKQAQKAARSRQSRRGNYQKTVADFAAVNNASTAGQQCRIGQKDPKKNYSVSIGCGMF